MRAILEFDLPADHESFLSACHADTWRYALVDISNELRSLIKHGTESPLPSDLIARLEEIRALIPYNVHLEE